MPSGISSVSEGNGYHCKKPDLSEDKSGFLHAKEQYNGAYAGVRKAIRCVAKLVPAKNVIVIYLADGFVVFQEVIRTPF